MESPSVSSPMAPDDPPRVKFLCSFGGSILPRPLDGRLRYVGGETRIVSFPRHFSYDDLITRMRELFDGTGFIKYQQPDEDLDALVSVVNDDDVMNMMEEYDKLGASSDGITRLRLFFFSYQQLDLDPVTAAHLESDERETERRYVDALNSLIDTRSPASPDAPEQFPGSPGLDYGIHTPLSLHHLNIPPQSSHGQRFGEAELPWSSAYFSPNRHPAHDPREFPSSPSSARYHMGEFSDRIPDEYVWLPPVNVIQEKAGFPSNLGHTHNGFEGSNICEHCRMVFQRNPDTRYLDPRWKQGQPYIEQVSTANEYATNFLDSCTNCYYNREGYMFNQDVKLDHGGYVKEQTEHQLKILHLQQASHHLEDPRVHLSGSGRVGEHSNVDDNAMNVSFSHGNFYEGHSVPSNCVNLEDTRYFRPGSELGSEIFHAQQPVGGYGNHPSAYGADNLYQLPQNLPPIQSIRRKVHVPIHPELSYESAGLMMPNGGVNSGFLRSPQDVSPRLSRIGVENQIQSSWVKQNGSISQKIPGFDGSAAPEFLYDHGLRSNPNFIDQAPTLVDEKLVASTAFGYHPFSNMGGTDVVPRMRLPEEKNPIFETYETKHEDIAKESDLLESPSPNEKQNLDFDSNKATHVEGDCYSRKVVGAEADAANERINNSLESLNFLPELIASVKKAALESAEVVKARAEADSDEKEASSHEVELGYLQNACIELEADSDGDGEHQKISKIEPTTAEAEALAKGLQTIRNDDLEEIRELGSGTYGSVFHGKWKGSDVAIKRIKASCFAGRPSERERLIADFWKEALILSSLHHPNVVSFYGVVRDGPDGSLATVTEFMVNGSLKQFLQKKDRTIDRRKRLIIAMDAAFGMEYLHGKNIVHFDLKCENLLVNMRDPHRPICKIGDLGLSKVKQHTLVSGGVRGTLPWMAPELLSGKNDMVTEKIDVYSFGIVMWELLTGEEPYADRRCASIIGGIVNNTLRPQIPTWCDPEWKGLMESSWSSDPGKRPSFSEISQKLRKMAAAINVK